ncbi:attachment protein [Novosphingobium umbonatum]|uniref:Attachment protein n=1 Tax=Novosphingobium umbonatum TaxID=1908524 RepID=A0A437N215_9SPHN|nr:host attachment protein [Novosphingobium umbonatum]RVU03958.1 attachment protein [Novosphingobium umbonatum]
MLLPHGTIVAVLDGRHFHLLRNAGDEANPELAEIDTPKLDTHNHSGASHRDGGAAVMTEDAHVLAAVDWLNHEVQGKRIDHLVIIAPPRSMGEIRKAYTKALEQKLLGELAKDLSAKAPAQVLAALRGK